MNVTNVFLLIHPAGMKKILLLLFSLTLTFYVFANPTAKEYEATSQIWSADGTVNELINPNNPAVCIQPVASKPEEAPAESLKTTLSNSTAQSYVFSDSKARIKVTLNQLNDSLTLKIEFTNQSNSSVYIDAEMPLSYQWTPAGNELMIEYGSDSSKESAFPVIQIKGGETRDFLLKMPRKTTKFKMNLLVSYFESTSLAVQNVLLNASNRKGSWKWSQYHVPILLKH